MKPTRTIHSFVKRHRRLCSNKQKIYDANWPIYGLDLTHGIITNNKIFTTSSPLILEIGFGTGTTLLNYAMKYPECNIIGIETYQPGIAALLSQLAINPLPNIRIYHDDAINVLQHCIPNNSLAKVLIFFPDPWPKKRHHKRRLIKTDFIELLKQKLKPPAILHITTDWEDYAKHIVTTLKNSTGFLQLNTNDSLLIIADRISTKFEQRGKKRGHQIFDLVYTLSP